MSKQQGYTPKEKELIRELYLNGDTYRSIARQVLKDESKNSKETIRSYIRTQDYYQPRTTRTNKSADDFLPSSFELKNDGNIVSQRVLDLSFNNKINDKSLLLAHGFENPNAWKITSVVNNTWGDGLFQSKITVKPLEEYIDFDEVKEWLETVDFSNIISLSTITESEVSLVDNFITDTQTDNYLVIPLYDLHFGINTLEDYDIAIYRLNKIIKKGYKEILIISGGDLLHTDNKQGTTASGTMIESIDLTNAWKDAFIFIKSLIESCIDNSDKVTYSYVEGNHDTTSGLTVQLAMEQCFIDTEDNLIIDVNTTSKEQEVYKAYLLGHNFIGATHGHKSKIKNYPAIFATMFSQKWGGKNVKTRELYTGHLHHERVIDNEGLTIIQVPTKAKTDIWHQENGFVTSHKHFIVSEYNEYEKITTYYI